MVVKQRHGWGYRSLVAEVSDSIHLRRFCRIALSERVPDESTVRKLTRRIGPETVNDMTRELISAAVRERRFRAGAVRIDSTVIEADIKHPTDAALAAQGVKALAREGRKLAAKLTDTTARVRDRSRAIGRRLRAITRTIRRRTGEAKAQVHALTEQTGELLQRSVKEARRLAATARRTARGRGARAKLRAARALDELADLCEKVAKQIRQRVRGEKITDRLISLADPDARPIRKGKLGEPTEFGYVAQIAEVTPNTKRGARGLIVPAASLPGNPVENTLLPQTVAELASNRCLHSVMPRCGFARHQPPAGSSNRGPRARPVPSASCASAHGDAHDRWRQRLPHPRAHRPRHFGVFSPVGGDPGVARTA